MVNWVVPLVTTWGQAGSAAAVAAEEGCAAGDAGVCAWAVHRPAVINKESVSREKIERW